MTPPPGKQRIRCIEVKTFHVKETKLEDAFSKPIDEVYDTVYAVPKSRRPNPTTYLTPQFMETHTNEFINGSARVDTSSAFKFRYKDNIELGLPFGRPDAVFVSPSSLIDELHATGNPAVIESTLGFDKGTFSESGSMTRTYIDSPKEVGLRFADGTAGGANPLWVPGEYTLNTTGGTGLPEMVTNQLPSPIKNPLIRIIKLTRLRMR